MMRAAGGVKYRMSLEGQLRSQDRPADGPRRTIEDAFEKRILQRADLVQITDLALHPATGIGMLQRFHVSAIVKLQQAFDTGGLAWPEICVRQPTQHPCEIHNGGVTNDFQRVVCTESSSSKGLAADKDRQRQRVTCIEQTHCQTILHAIATECG
jgi:hypothetical protein